MNHTFKAESATSSWHVIGTTWWHTHETSIRNLFQDPTDNLWIPRWLAVETSNTLGRMMQSRGLPKYLQGSANYVYLIRWRRNILPKRTWPPRWRMAKSLQQNKTRHKGPSASSDRATSHSGSLTYPRAGCANNVWVQASLVFDNARCWEWQAKI